MIIIFSLHVLESDSEPLSSFTPSLAMCFSSVSLASPFPICCMTDMYIKQSLLQVYCRHSPYSCLSVLKLWTSARTAQGAGG